MIVLICTAAALATLMKPGWKSMLTVRKTGDSDCPVEFEQPAAKAIAPASAIRDQLSLFHIAFPLTTGESGE